MYCERVFPPDSRSPRFIFCPVFDRRVELGTAGSIVHRVESFCCRSETIAHSLRQIKCGGGFSSPLRLLWLWIPLSFQRRRMRRSWVGLREYPLNDRTDGGAAPSYRPKVRTFLSTALNPHSASERAEPSLQSRPTLLGFSRSNDYNFGFIWRGYFVPSFDSLKAMNGHSAVKSEIVPSFSNVDKYSTKFG